MSVVRAIPLGGVGEIGKNMMLIEIDGRILIIDAGVMFPEEDHLGIDLVIPDISYLLDNKEMIDGIVLTHGHEDHIGALPYVLKEINVPVYGTRLTLGLVDAKLKEHTFCQEIILNEIAPGEPIKIGSFEIELIRVNHSIADTCALAVETPKGPIIYASDFKFDQTPIDGIVADFHKLGGYGDRGVLALFSDSTNAEREGLSLSEKVVGDKIDSVFSTTRGRIIIATFASNVHRVQQVVDAAYAYKRKVAIIGRSMINNCQIAAELGYLHIPADMIVDIDQIQNMDPDRITILTTGSQGEPMAALTRIARGEHRQIRIIPGDTVMVSASPIPGNERLVGETINKLFRLGANVIYQAITGVHVSGHANREELKLMFNLVRPQYFVPVHGEYRHLYHHAQLVETLGLNKENIFILDPGSILEFKEDGAEVVDTFNAENILIDGLGIGDVGNVVLRERRLLSEDGILVVVMSIDKDGNVVAGPDIITRGFVYIKESEDLIKDAVVVVEEVLKNNDYGKNMPWSRLKSRIRSALSNFVIHRLRRRPMILPIIMEV